MARKVSFSALESRSARLRLKIRRRPYGGPSLARGIGLMYRRNKTNGTWVLKSSDGKMESRPLARSGAGPGVEVYELRLAGHAAHVSEPHAPGTRELVTVLHGSLKMSVGEETYLLAVGDSLVFPADQKHVYENPGAVEARYHNVIVYRR